MDQKLQNLTKLGGVVAVELGLLHPQQQEEIAYIQAVFGELHKKTEKDFRAFPFPKNPAELKQLITENQLDELEIQKTAASLGPTAFAPKGAPRYMDAAEMAGFLPKSQSNPLLAAQAGAKLASLSEQMRTGDFGDKLPTLATALDPKTHQFIDEGPSKNPPEPGYVTAAQSTEHLARIFSAALIERSNSSLLQDTDVRRAVQAFQLYASQTLKRAGSEMESAGAPQAGRIIKESRRTLHGFDKVNPLSELANTTALTNDIRRGFEKIGLMPEVMQLVETRLQQSRGMQHKGIAIAPFTRGTADIESSWVSRVQAGRNNGGHQQGV